MSVLRTYSMSALFLFCSAFQIIALAESQSGTQTERKLTILNWEAYLSASVIKQWQEETGVAIEEIYIDGDEMRDSILASSAHQNIDIAMVDEVAARQFGKKKTLKSLSPEQIPNLRHIPQRWQQQCSEYAVPYMWGTLGIAYRNDKVVPAPTSWLELLQPNDSLKGHIGMIDDHVDMLVPSLILQGVSISSDDPEVLKSAFTMLMEQAPDVLTYQYSISYVQAGEHPDDLHMTMTYSGDQFALGELSDNPSAWSYAIPKEGTLLWADCLAVLSGSKNIDLAQQFIDFLHRPEIAAKNSQDIYMASPNSAAMAFIDEEVKADISLYPPQSVMNNSQIYQVLEMQNVKQRNRITRAVRKKHQMSLMEADK
ncbi:MAG: spermidine/putrescine ABC transporter substrate-binding protein [Motiliproteus sp.]|nr:spermidine/putrescine ABC transporter substrate-binding protein [Motiliproteus sp.]MCW9053353.1 spermidine/putrescine ABC transporter substrate-binding protein [Motiliproteus sp.]